MRLARTPQKRQRMGRGHNTWAMRKKHRQTSPQNIRSFHVLSFPGVCVCVGVKKRDLLQKTASYMTLVMTLNWLCEDLIDILGGTDANLHQRILADLFETRQTHTKTHSRLISKGCVHARWTFALLSVHLHIHMVHTGAERITAIASSACWCSLHARLHNFTMFR